MREFLLHAPPIHLCEFSLLSNWREENSIVKWRCTEKEHDCVWSALQRCGWPPDQNEGMQTLRVECEIGSEGGYSTFGEYQHGQNFINMPTEGGRGCRRDARRAGTAVNNSRRLLCRTVGEARASISHARISFLIRDFQYAPDLILRIDRPAFVKRVAIGGRNKITSRSTRASLANNLWAD